MKSFTHMAGITGVAMLLGSTAALAQVTPAQVWEGWQEQAAAMGARLDAVTTGADGPDFRAEGVTYSFSQLTDDDLTVSVHIEHVVFEDAGDGSVQITFAEDARLEVTGQDTEGDMAGLTFDIAAPGLDISASGEPEALRYAFTAPQIDLSLAEVYGGASDEFEGEIMVSVTDLAGEHFQETSGNHALESFFEMGRISFDVNAENPVGSERVVATGQSTDVGFVLAGERMDGLDAANVADALESGFFMEGGFGHGGSSYDVEFSDESGDGSFVASSSEGETSFGFGPEGLSYEGRSVDGMISMTGTMMPLPAVNVDFKEISFSTMLPVAESESPQGFATSILIDELNVGEEIWSMIDAGGALPREPLRFVLDIDGLANWESNILDTAVQAPHMMLMQPPAQLGELHEINLNELALSVIGAELTGGGSFTFDNEDLTTFPGMPRPTGEVTFTLRGAEATVDRLVSLGVIGQEDAMGAMMMMSMFARPGDGEDTLTSTLEVTEDGGVLANGQRIQ